MINFWSHIYISSWHLYSYIQVISCQQDELTTSLTTTNRLYYMYHVQLRYMNWNKITTIKRLSFTKPDNGQHFPDVKCKDISSLSHGWSKQYWRNMYFSFTAYNHVHLNKWADKSQIYTLALSWVHFIFMQINSNHCWISTMWFKLSLVNACSLLDAVNHY